MSSESQRVMRSRLRKQFAELDREQLLEIVTDLRSDQMARLDAALATARVAFSHPRLPTLTRRPRHPVPLSQLESLLRGSQDGLLIKEIAARVYADRKDWPRQYRESLRLCLLRLEKQLVAGGEVLRRIPPRGQTRYSIGRL